MFSPTCLKLRYGTRTLTMETGIVARQADASVMVSMDDTTVLAAIVGNPEAKTHQRFFPLVVHYQERTYAAGRFPGGFFRREGRPSEEEVLVSRLIDRALRPLFPSSFLHEVQIVVTVVSVNPQVHPDIVAVIAASAALSISGIPVASGPVGIARVGCLDGCWVLNPSTSDLARSGLDLVVSGTDASILMVEAQAHFLRDAQMLDAVFFGHRSQQVVVDAIAEFADRVGVATWRWDRPTVPRELRRTVRAAAQKSIERACGIHEKRRRIRALDATESEVLTVLRRENVSFAEEEVHKILQTLETETVRDNIVRNDSRLDGRRHDEVREMDTRVGVLPRAHGSALFTRGNTQTLVSATLGTERNAQNIDALMGEHIDRFLVHYNFPPYCVGEIGIVGPPKRREIGHGRLTKKGILPVMPNASNFPYTVRVVSEVTESNGSSSMASVCGASLALMDAGVPITGPVAGVAMGLVRTSDRFVVLTDISGDEDHFGDMDLKIVGNATGVTALQLDTKTVALTRAILTDAFRQAGEARLRVLEHMQKSIRVPRAHVSRFAPKIRLVRVNPNKIGDLIGKGGSTIRSLTERTKTSIDIQNDGVVQVSAAHDAHIDEAVDGIEQITADLQVGSVHSGRVTRIVRFGVFVRVAGKEGLVYAPQGLRPSHPQSAARRLKQGQEVTVEVVEVDQRNRVRLRIADDRPTDRPLR